MYEAIAFYFFSLITIVLFLITVLSNNALYSMSSLAGGMIFIGGFFFLLDAEFLGIVQIIVYTGAVMALYAFGMMFFDSTKDIKENQKCKKTIYTLSILSSVLIVFIFYAPFVANGVEKTVFSTDLNNVQQLGLILFTKYLIPFEVAALMLLVAMISGIVLVGKDMNNSITEKETEAKGDVA